MSESKIGKWLTRDGRTAVVFAEDGSGHMHGVVCYDGGVWSARTWDKHGFWSSDTNHSRTLSHRVSDSTDLTPYVPVKRVRPWTRAEVEAIVQHRPLWVRSKARPEAALGLVECVGSSGVDLPGSAYVTYGELANDCIQLDGSPCGVEVEE